MRGLSVGRVLASKNSEINVGDYATAFSGWRDLAVLGPTEATVIKPQPGMQISDLVGVLRK